MPFLLLGHYNGSWVNCSVVDLVLGFVKTLLWFSSPLASKVLRAGPGFCFHGSWNLSNKKILGTCLHFTSSFWNLVNDHFLLYSPGFLSCWDQFVFWGDLFSPASALITFVAIFQHCCFVAPLVFCRVITQFSVKAWNAWKSFAQPSYSILRLCWLKVGGALADLF